jgi:hypothetical protein
MILLPQTVLDILAASGSVRLPANGLLLQTMQQYAAAARQGGGTVEFVIGDAMLLPQTMIEVSAIGDGHVRWDLVAPHS